MHDKTNWPEWLKNARISDDAEIEIKSNGWVIWRHGRFEGGRFEGGSFEGGSFEGGSFEGGSFEGGSFEWGSFEGGRFLGGRFLGGSFEGGYQSCIGRCKWQVSFNIYSQTVKIGCKEKTIDDWDSWFSSDEVFETPRDSEQFDLILQSYKNAKAVVLALQE